MKLVFILMVSSVTSMNCPLNSPCQPEGGWPPETAEAVYNTLEECKTAIAKTPFEMRYMARMRCVPSHTSE